MGRAPRPEIHSPDQSDGDVASLLFFPNPSPKHSKQLEQVIAAAPKQPVEARIPIDLDMSADGKRVAFVVMEHVPGEPKRRQRIWVTETEQAASRPFLSGECDEMYPRWSPDGKHLAFMTQASYGEKRPQLHLIAAEGGTPQHVWGFSHGISKLAWAPDGSCITFLSPDKEELELASDASKPTPCARLWAVCQAKHGLTRFEGTWTPAWGFQV